MERRARTLHFSLRTQHRAAKVMGATLVLSGLVLVAVHGTAVAGVTQGTRSDAVRADLAASDFTTPTWSVTVPGSGDIVMSSPNVANLTGGPAVVVGDDESGAVMAYSLATGAPVWNFIAGGPVDSSPSVAPVNPGGLDSVYVGTGDAQRATAGGYQAVSPSGTSQWFVQGNNPSTDKAYPVNGVAASMAVGDLEGGTDVVGGTLGQEIYAMGASSGQVLSGYPWVSADSTFSSAAIADLYGNGQNEVIIGGNSSAGAANGMTYQNGGHLRILSATGNAGTKNPAGGLVCQYNTNQTIDWSSPAVGNFLAGSGTGIVIGTGDYYPSSNSDTDALIATNSHCALQWEDHLDGLTTSSPALADVLGNGQLQVIEGTNSGSVYALNGATGATLWKTDVGSGVSGSVVTADFGAGYQNVLVPVSDGSLDVLNGQTGAIITSIDTDVSLQNSPLVTDDPNGTIGITIAGGNRITHYEIAGSNGSVVDEAGAWPQFHHDPQLTGDAGTPASGTGVGSIPCGVLPSGSVTGMAATADDQGYWIANAYGQVDACGDAADYGQPPDGGHPIVDIAATPAGQGYWLVSNSGQVYTYGDANYYGAPSGPLNAPIVGIAPTADGKGYWLVASDGGIFTYGDAQFRGSTGNIHLNKPIVGMTADPQTGGYWFVASDGGVFAFNAPFLGSMGSTHLNKPVVGMAVDEATGGYWLVASDGGIFSFGAGTPFFGSTGALSLAKPIVGMESAPSGHGYRFVASDGGIFDFGSSLFEGSAA
jgi:outer membrane protein assembly factor BamB